MPMLSEECTAFRLPEITCKRPVVSGENKYVLPMSGFMLKRLIDYGKFGILCDKNTMFTSH